MQAGLLRYKITIQEAHTEHSEYGVLTQEQWVSVFSTRARVQFKSEKQTNSIGEPITQRVIVFTIRDHFKVTHRHRILFNGEKYSIDSVEPDLAAQAIHIHASLINE